MTRLLTALFGVLAVASPAPAQIVNVLSKLKADEDGLGGKMQIAALLKRGNTELTQVKGGAGLGYRSGRHTVLGTGAFAYGTKGNDVFLDDSFEHLRYRFEWVDGWFVEGYLQHEANAFRSLSLRGLGGVGPRHEAHPGEGVTLAVGTAAMFELERRGTPASEVTAWRWSTYLQALIKIGDGVAVEHVTFAQPRFNDLDDLRVKSDTALEVSLTTWLALRQSLSVHFDARPPDEVERLDTTVDTSLLVSF